MDPKIIQKVGDETLVYDQQGDKVHLLNESASRVYRLLDGDCSQEELRQAFVERYPEMAEVSAEVVSESVALLADEGLLNDFPQLQEGQRSSVSRRKFLKAAGVAVPLVLAVSAPRPAIAQSLVTCITNGKNGFCFPAGTTRAQICVQLGQVGTMTVDFSAGDCSTVAAVGQVLPCDGVALAQQRCFANS